MRSLLTILIILFLLPVAASAQEANKPAQPARGSLTSPQQAKVPPQPTKEQMAQANAIYAQCNSSGEKNYFDCSCVSARFLELKALDSVAGSLRTTLSLRTEAQKYCANTPEVAGQAYEQCLSWAKRTREDYESFCSCYAREYAGKFSAAPTTSFLSDQKRMSGAMSVCGGGKAALAKVERNRTIRQMKKDGTYDSLFPGGTPDFAKTKPPAPMPPRTGTSQILSDRLSAPDTGNNTQRR